MISTALVVAPHPDDEVLGAGGTIAKLATEGTKVHVAIVTRGDPPQFSAEALVRVRRECAEAAKVLGVTKVHFLDLPAAGLHLVPPSRVNQALLDLMTEVRPEWLFIPFAADIHLDHQVTALSAMVAARPVGDHAPRRIMAYETQSETNWNAPLITQAFRPNMFVDIVAHLDRKLAAMRCYQSQVREFPSERSVEALEALARVRGSTVGIRAAEGFIVLREIVSAT